METDIEGRLDCLEVQVAEMQDHYAGLNSRKMELGDGLKRFKRVEFIQTWTTAKLFERLGLEPPPKGVQVHILLARSHGNAGSYYHIGDGSLVVEIRIAWNEPEK